MNLTLTTVLSDITGKTGMRILRAIVAGERDGLTLAKLRDQRVKADEPTLARALSGHWREEHLYALGQALAHYDFLEQQLGDCDRRVVEVLSKLTLTPDAKVAPARKRLQGGHRTSPQREALRAALYRAVGVDLTAIPTIGLDTALTIAAEVGSDLSRFPDSQHFVPGQPSHQVRASVAANRCPVARRVSSIASDRPFVWPLPKRATATPETEDATHRAR